MNIIYIYIYIMIIINNLLNYSIYFKYYLSIILFLNLILFLNFVFIKIYKNIAFNSFNISEIETETNKYNINFDIQYCFKFKKIKKIINNPIIFEYQIKQSNIINKNSNKYIEYKKDLKIIYSKNNKLLNSYLYYKNIKKILLINGYNKKNINNILIKLFCINF
jgi:hypothetical protein